jgi:hypothetical protein
VHDKIGEIIYSKNESGVLTCFRAPTSLVPSPHIRVILPTVLKVVKISSFCSGATLAKT